MSKYYRTIIQVEVLSEDSPLTNVDSLHDVASAIDEGDCSGKVKITKVEELTGKQAAKALKAQGSDPEFFMLDDDGNPIE